MTGEGWNELMHSLAKDSHYFGVVMGEPCTRGHRRVRPSRLVRAGSGSFQTIQLRFLRFRILFFCSQGLLQRRVVAHSVSNAGVDDFQITADNFASLEERCLIENPVGCG